MSKLDTALSALKGVVNGMPDEVIDTHIRNILDRCEEAIKEIEDNEQDKTCVPVVPQATEEQRETLHQKAIGKHIETKIEYQLMLRYQSDTELVVDVREDTIDLDDNPMGEEYVEGFSYDGSSLKKNYKDAVADFLELRLKYPDAYEYDEVLEEATDLLAIRYGKGSWQVEARDRFGCPVDR